MVESGEALVAELDAATRGLKKLVDADESTMSSPEMQGRVEGLIRRAIVVLDESGQIIDGHVASQIGPPMLARDVLLSAEVIRGALHARTQKRRSP